MLTPAASRCSWRHYSASAQGVLLFIFKKYTEVKHVNTEEKCSLPICSGPVVHPILSGQVKMLLSARRNKQNTFSAWYGHWWKFRLFSSPPSKNHLHRQNVKIFCSKSLKSRPFRETRNMELKEASGCSFVTVSTTWKEIRDRNRNLNFLKIALTFLASGLCSYKPGSYKRSC